jgi:crossover junction endodeoxyribonuclease RuvC
VIILGIDPGIATTGYGVVEKKGSKFSLCTYGTITTAAHTPLSERLVLLFDNMSQLLTRYSPTHVAVEELFFSTNAKTAMTVGQARGVILLCSEKHQKTPASYTPLQVKQAVCGYGKADKKQVQYMVKTLLNLKDIPKPDDAADALAIAICHGHSYKLKSIL